MRFTKEALITKLKATSIHFSLSLVVFAILAYLVFYHWYPQPYFSVDGGWQGIRLIALVDLVLGPMITFLIFDLSKRRKEIIFDLAIIFVVQVSALIYGVHTTYAQRPVAVVLLDEFLSSTVKEQFAGSLESTDVLRRYSDERPPIIFADLPLVTAAILEAQRIKDEQGIWHHAQMRLYRPRAELTTAIKARQASYQSRLSMENTETDYRAWLARNSKTSEDVMIGPFVGRYDRVWLVFDLEANYLDYF